MKSVAVILLLLVVTLGFATNVIVRTVSADSSILSGIRSSLDNTNANYDPVLGMLRLVRNIPDEDDLPDGFPLGFTSLKTAANRLSDGLFNPEPDYQVDELDEALLAIPQYLSVSPMMDFFTGVGYSTIEEAAFRGLSLAQVCINASCLYDCIYYLRDDAIYGVRVTNALVSLKGIMLQSIAYLDSAEVFYIGIRNGQISGYKQYQHGVWAKDFRTQPDGNGYLGEPPWPGFNLLQYRLLMYGAAGYAALLIAETTDDPALQQVMQDKISYIDQKLLDYVLPEVFPADMQRQGMLSFHTNNSGAYNESITYAGMVLKYLTPYFVARKRLSGGSVNHFNNQYIASWVNDLTKKVIPWKADGFPVAVNWNYNDSFFNIGFYPGTLMFFYHADGAYNSVKLNIAWYIKCFEDVTTSPERYWYQDNSRNDLISFSFLMAYCSEPTCDPKVLELNSLPGYIQDGSWSNSEFSILRPPSSSKAEFLSSPSLNVLHENSWGSAHAHADQTSYTFHYNGERYLLDSSGANYTDMHDWRKSPYAHNMLIVDPVDDTVVANLFNCGHPVYRPVSGIQDFNKSSFTANEVEPDPCRKDYFQRGDHLDLLSLSLDYRDPDDRLLPIDEQRIESNLKRSFLRDNDIYIIYDQIDTIDDTVSHEFWNLMHYDNSVSIVDNVCTIVKLSTIDIACGSYDSSYSVDEVADLQSFTTPGATPYLRGKQMVTGSTDPSFLTVIIPRTGASTRILGKVTTADENYCVAVSDISPSFPSQTTTTFVGCTNGVEQDISLAANVIETDARMFNVTRLNGTPELTLDKSIVLLSGSKLSVNNDLLYQAYDCNVSGVTCGYANDQLRIVFHSESLSYPRFRVYKSGTNPDLFTAIMRTPGAEPFPYPDESDFRYISTDIIQSLAYDDQYFYVNYTWDELIAADLIDASLVMVKGIIPEALLTVDLRIQGDIQLVGDLTVAAGASMHIGSNSNLLAADGVMIANHGSLIIDGGVERSISLSKLGQQWTGIATFRDGNLSCDGAVIDGAETGILIRGAANVMNSEIFDCNQGVCVETQAAFAISNNLIHGNTYGVISSNNYSTSQSGYIEYNEIYENEMGILLYNSNSNISFNDIHHNSMVGLYLLRGSEPLVKYCNVSFTEDDNQAKPEIRLESDSYPILDEAHNDINTDGIGHSLYYTPGGFAGSIKPLKATYNFWGSTDYSTIREWIYPEEWEVTFAPFCVEPNTTFTHEFDTMFKQALAAEESGNITYARQLYTLIVASEPDSLHALQSLGRLNSIYAGSPDLISELRGIYDSYMIACSDSVLVKSAEIKLIMLDRFDGLYQQALQGYNDQLQQAWTDLDSLLCLLDIAYTMQDMYYDDLTKGSHSGISYHSNGLNIASLKDARSSIEQLWGELLTRSDEAGIEYVPVPVKLDVMNYPNPFNPSTTIAFSLPNEGTVRVSIFNLRGQRVCELINSEMPRGFHKVVWDGKDSGNRSVSSGVYFVRIETGKTTALRKIMLMK